MSKNGIRAFSDSRYDYYELTVDLYGVVPKGAIFVHDSDDSQKGSIADGCLELCWTPEGGCYGLCGGTIVLHTNFKDTPMFKLAKTGNQRKYSGLYSAINEAKKMIDGLTKTVENLENLVSGLE